MSEPRYGWVMVALGAFMTCIAIGAMFSLAVFLQPITQATGWSHTAVSSAMTLNFLAMGAAGFGWGALSDRIGPRTVVLAGAILLGLGLFLASRAQSALAVPARVRPAGRHRRGQLLLADDRRGHGLDQRAARPRGVAGLGRRRRRADDHVAVRRVAHHANGLARRPRRHRHAGLGDARARGALRAPSAAARRRVAAAERTPLRLRDAFVSAPFIVLALTFFACCAAHAGPIFHTVTYAMTCGLAPLAAVTVYSVEGLAGLGGRLALGVAPTASA